MHGVSATGRFIPARAGNTDGSNSPFMSLALSVHPRAGGEHPLCPWDPSRLAGSSPRGRGTRQTESTSQQNVRFIPARAGNTQTHESSESAVRFTVHPRAGGEHGQLLRGHEDGSGSSPRGRGTRGPLSGAIAARRFIPARAGNTEQTYLTGSVDTVGSSPRGRGTLSEHAICILLAMRRFIPARAGNTALLPLAQMLSAVHPRAGGEHGLAIHEALVGGGSSPRGRGTRGWRPVAAWGPTYGSSPRGRGTLPNIGFPCFCTRFIPARAGNTDGVETFHFSSTVHPRAGGEHAFEYVFDVRVESHPVHPRAGGEHNVCGPTQYTTTGSSPRGRGTHRDGGREHRGGRFIPARAGNTRLKSGRPRRPTVHPRAGGEHSGKRSRKLRRCGSSPRGRGTR